VKISNDVKAKRSWFALAVSKSDSASGIVFESVQCRFTSRLRSLVSSIARGTVRCVYASSLSRRNSRFCSRLRSNSKDNKFLEQVRRKANASRSSAGMFSRKCGILVSCSQIEDLSRNGIGLAWIVRIHIVIWSLNHCLTAYQNISGPVGRQLGHQSIRLRIVE
jgi:hypothetical protein